MSLTIKQVYHEAKNIPDNNPIPTVKWLIQQYGIGDTLRIVEANSIIKFTLEDFHHDET